MKVLQINSVCGYGSTGNIAVDLCHELEKYGHECCVAYGRGKAPDTVESYRIGTNMDVYIHGGLSRITDRQGFYSTKATKQFIHWMKEYNPDVVHLHNLHGYYMNIKVLFHALKSMDKPVIWTLHDCWAFTGHCACFDYAKCMKWKNGCGNCPQKKEYPVSWFMDQSKKNYMDKKNIFCSLEKLEIITPSHWLKSLTEESFLGKYNIKVIHNGIDLTIFKPGTVAQKKNYGLEDKKVVLGVANEWSARKGLGDFVRLARMLPDSYSIVLIGHIKKKVEKLPDNLVLIQHTASRTELAEWYSEAEVLFNPTYEDNYPTVNLEAQACGTPVITYDTGGSPEGVKEYGGIVVQKGDIQTVAKLIRNEKRKKTPAGDIKQLSKERMIEEYLRCYQEK